LHFVGIWPVRFLEVAYSEVYRNQVAFVARVPSIVLLVADDVLFWAIS